MKEKIKIFWKKQSLAKKIIIVILILAVVGIIARSWVFTIIAWLAIIFFAVKFMLDFEL